MGVKVTFKDLGIDAVFRKMQALESLTLTVGVQGRKAAKIVGRKTIKGSGGLRGATAVVSEGTPLGAIAFFNEFGTDTIPARPFLRPAIFNNREETARKIAKEMEIYVARKQRDALTTLGNIGKDVASKVRARVENAGSFVPNAPSTVKGKGSSRPLHDSGRLSRSISWAVRGPGGSIISEGAAR